MIANQGGSEFDCASDGSFEPLQCRSRTTDLLDCVCVEPSTGNAIENTAMAVADMDDALECDHLGERIVENNTIQIENNPYTIIMHTKYSTCTIILAYNTYIAGQVYSCTFCGHV